MSQEVQLFFICPISEDDRDKDSSLKGYKYLQYMGQNKNSAILCSLIHYALNRKYLKILQDLIELITYSQNKSKYQEILNMIDQTKDLINPVKMFFQKLYQVDQKNEITEKLLQEYCYEKGLLNGEEISYSKLANLLRMSISFSSNTNNIEIYGRDHKDSIDLKVTNRKKYFYLIPEPIFYSIPIKNCQVCRSQNELIALNCKHQYCYKCLDRCQTYSCCQQFNSRTFLEIKREELKKLKVYNERSKELQKYYESSKQNVLQLNQDNNQLQMAPIMDPLQECNACFKKFKYQLFILKDCKHKYCYDCMFKWKSYKYCFVSNCNQMIDQYEFQNYLIKTKNEIIEETGMKQNQKQSQQISIQEQESRIMDLCSKCNQIQPYKLFQIKNCNHKFCNQCLSKIDMKYITLRCLVYSCQETFKSQEYNIYIKQLQDLSRQEEQPLKNNNSQQQLQYFKCDDCLRNSTEDLKYVLNCGHSVCYQCMIKDSYFRDCCKKASQKDQEYVNFRKNITTNCKGCQNNFPIKNLCILTCQHEFCLSCCQKIYQRKPYKCLDKICEKTISFDKGLSKFISDQILEQSKESAPKEESNKIIIQKEEDLQIEKRIENKGNNKNIIIHEEEKIIEQNSTQDYNKTEESKSLSVQNSATNLQESIKPKQENLKQQEEFQQKEILLSNKSIIQNPILNQNQKKQIKQQFLKADQIQKDDYEDIILNQQIEEIKLVDKEDTEFQNEFCTNCLQPFSCYNTKQVINCKSHEIGVCCILTKFINCPQCEQATSKKIKIKENLILPTNPVEIEIVFETTLPKKSLANYYPQSYQQTSQGISENFQNIDRLRLNEGSAIKRNVTTDTINQRGLYSQKQLEDKFKLKNDFTLQRSNPYTLQSYQPQKYGRYDQDYRQVFNNNLVPQNYRNSTHFSSRLV